MLAKLSVDQALMKAKSHVRKGKPIEAKKLYEDILKKYSKNKRAQQGLSDLNKFSRISTTQDPPEDIINDEVKKLSQFVRTCCSLILSFTLKKGK